ncbi:hypothetical protein BD833_103305 [Blastococcus xanthinilyticus]|uniref:Uncharacterized protein n=1 Tax=Blastococcus xanthinilyticus TaxID=1564164 RepID=A0A5S5D1M4_9ACTN|nr:hypothetical protein BD833_103305 [Blastococcus xanthinilyticus]
MLAQLARDEDAVRYPPIPRWFYVVQASAVAGISLAQLLPDAAGSALVLGLAVVMGLLGHRYWLNRDGVSWASAKFSDMAGFLALLLGALAVGWLVDETTDAWWIWIVTAVFTAGVVLVTGYRYGREFGHDG